MVVPAQPHFPNMPENTYTLWGYGFEIDDEGDCGSRPAVRA